MNKGNMLIEPPDAMDEVMLVAKAFAENCPLIEKFFSDNSILYNGYEKSFWGRKKLISTMKVERILNKKFIDYDSCDDNYFNISVYKGNHLIKEQITNYKFAHDAYIKHTTDMFTSHGFGTDHVTTLLNLYGYVIKDIEQLIKK